MLSFILFFPFLFFPLEYAAIFENGSQKLNILIIIWIYIYIYNISITILFLNLLKVVIE